MKINTTYHQQMNLSNANLRVIQLKMKNAINTTYHDNIMRYMYCAPHTPINMLTYDSHVPTLSKWFLVMF